MAPVCGHGFDLFGGVVIGAVVWHKMTLGFPVKLLVWRQMAAPTNCYGSWGEKVWNIFRYSVS